MRRPPPAEGRILGLDPGTKTIGAAVSDELHLTAHGVESIPASPADRALDTVKSLIKEYNVYEIVVGLPVNMNGTRGPSAEAAEGFARRLDGLVPGGVHMVDERMTTVMAERVLLEAELRRSKRRGLRDKVAAVIILQGYLDARRQADGE